VKAVQENVFAMEQKEPRVKEDYQVYKDLPDYQDSKD